MKSNDSRFVNDLVDPVRRAAAIPRARMARAIMYVTFLVTIAVLGILAAVLDFDSTIVLAFAALLAAFTLYLDILVKVLLAFDAADIGGQKNP